MHMWWCLRPRGLSHRLWRAFAPNEDNVLVVTATSGKALEQQAQRYADFIEANPDVSVGHLCYAVNTGRAALAQRAVFCGHDSEPDVLVKNLRAYASAPEYSAMAVGKANDVSSNVAMIFPSTLDASTMSCQYLFNTQPAFRHAIEKCGVSEQLFRGDRRRSVSFADSAVFAVVYGLYCMRTSWDVKPTILLGNGIGEVVAAVCSGVLELEYALNILGGTKIEAGRVEGPTVGLICPRTGKLRTAPSSDRNFLSSFAENLRMCLPPSA